jgi:hypothetical protein
MGDEIRPFQILVSEADLEDLKKRLRAREKPDLFVKELRACFGKMRAM